MTATSITTSTKTSTVLLADTLMHAWSAVRSGNDMSGEIDRSEHYDAAVWTAGQALRDAGLALEIAVEEAAEKRGVSMDDVLRLCSDRAACVG
ncbi:hypothetical protein ABH973_002617 [Bradyrhizobium ottawaense]|uniref:hypothetical protein n=1 Tax=Bradyrhizobium ottawaense TaxID=931866 RepID=UPI0035116FAE